MSPNKSNDAKEGLQSTDSTVLSEADGAKAARAALADCMRELAAANQQLADRALQLEEMRAAWLDRRDSANILNEQLIATRTTLIERTAALARATGHSSQDLPQAVPLADSTASEALPAREVAPGDPVLLAGPLDAISIAGRELIEMAREINRWGTLAWVDTKLRYRRTMLGPIWLTLSTAVLVLSVGMTYGAIFGHAAAQYMPYFMVGYILWSFISATIAEGCSVFLTAGGAIKSVPAPLSLHVFRMVARQGIVLAHNAVLIAIGWILLQWPIGWSTFLAVPGVALVFAATVGMVLLLGTACTRFRDLQQLVIALLQLLFLLTPIVWKPESMRGSARDLIWEWNPFFYLLEVVRGPLLGQAPGPFVWCTACLIAAVFLLAGAGLYGRYSHRIAIWL